MTTNGIKFESAHIESTKGIGSISNLSFGIDITAEPVASDNPMAPTHRASFACHVYACLDAVASGRSRTVTPVLSTSP